MLSPVLTIEGRRRSFPGGPVPRPTPVRRAAGWLLAALAAALLAGAPAQARDWHVDDQGPVTSGCAGGNDLGDAFRTIQAAVDCMAPGDTVLVHGGVYGGWGACRPSSPAACVSDPWTGRVLHLVGIQRTGGEPGRRFTISAAPGEKPVLDGLAVPSEPLDAAFHVVDSDFVTIRGFTMRNFSAGSRFCSGCGIENYGTIVWNRNSDDGEILDNVITDSDPGGTSCCFAADMNFGTTARRLRIRGNAIVTRLVLAISLHNTSPPDASRLYGIEVSGNHIVQTLDSGNAFFLRAVFVNKVNGVRISGNYIENRGVRQGDSTAVFLRDGNSFEVLGNIVRGYGTGIVLQDSGTEAGPGNFNDHERHVIANNVLDGLAPAGTVAAVNNRNGSARSCDGCVLRNNIVLNYERGFELDQTLSDPWPAGAVIGDNIMHNVARPTEGTSFNGDTIVEGTNEFAAPNPLESVLPLPDPASWTIRPAGGRTPATPYYQILPGSLAEDFGDNSTCPWSPADGLCDAGAYELSGAGTATCQDLGGAPCAPGETCDGGTFVPSSDAGDLCCTGGTCTPPPSCTDIDGDGFGEGCAPGPDCDDSEPAVHPGAAETCNGADEDCDGVVDEGLARLVSCGTGACRNRVLQWCSSGVMGPECHPGPAGVESCNSVDDDCDGETDEGPVCEPSTETHVVEAEYGVRSPASELVGDPEARFGLAIRTREASGAQPCSMALQDSLHAIRVKQPGSYRLWVRIKGPAYANDALCVGVGSAPPDRVFPDALGTYQWVPVEVTHGSGEYLHYLETGYNVIAIGRGEELATVDAICVTSELADGALSCSSAVSESVQVQ